MSLYVFIICTALTVFGLWLDGVLYGLQMKTISETVWDWPILGAPIVLNQVVGLLALVLHLWGQR
jgi:hypothetical protein